MKNQFMTTRIANVKVRVPVYIDKATTKALAGQVSERVAATESASDRIDTQAFALQTAFEFAVELDALKREHAEDEKELTIAFERIASKLKDLVSRAASAEE